MRLLLDTHTLLWSIGKTNELSKRAVQEIKNADNEILVSAVSLWEIALKYAIGKLIMDSFDIKKIPEYCKKMGFELIPLEPADALNSLYLPKKNTHKDPFDRMLIYQCIKNAYLLVSKDARIKIYKEDGLKYIW
ncbi:type II toxin-antitoxin system VapC family toxin [Treponema sp. TIM-1]|uniref:type II toxin-antitoxin system VapC family toxin n=1 Tax=Treponema sp. TIM-1 TaxID=2898417 RepID=UPI00397F7F8C